MEREIQKINDYMERHGAKGFYKKPENHISDIDTLCLKLNHRCENILRNSDSMQIRNQIHYIQNNITIVLDDIFRAYELIMKKQINEEYAELNEEVYLHCIRQLIRQLIDYNNRFPLEFNIHQRVPLAILLERCGGVEEEEIKRILTLLKEGNIDSFLATLISDYIRSIKSSAFAGKLTWESFKYGTTFISKLKKHFQESIDGEFPNDKIMGLLIYLNFNDKKLVDYYRRKFISISSRETFATSEERDSLLFHLKECKQATVLENCSYDVDKKTLKEILCEALESEISYFETGNFILSEELLKPDNSTNVKIFDITISANLFASLINLLIVEGVLKLKNKKEFIRLIKNFATFNGEDRKLKTIYDGLYNVSDSTLVELRDKLRYWANNITERYFNNKK